MALPKTEPLGGSIMSVIICLVSISIISGFFAQRIVALKNWRRIPFVVWIVFAIYTDSYLFVFFTAILQFALGVNTNIHICDGAILLCLVCYITTKVLIYLFLVEKAHIIRGGMKPRLKSKLYILNSFVMLGIYAVIAIMNFIFRITRIDHGQCYIGMQKVSMIPLISFDAVVNIYLTILFLIPLQSLYSFKHCPTNPPNTRLRTVAFRTFIGTLCTLTSSVVNLTVLMVLDGEPGWVCLMCCNSDVLFSAIVIQWVTSKDNVATARLSGSGSNRETFEELRRPAYSPRNPPSQKHVMGDIPEISLHNFVFSNNVTSNSDSSEAELTTQEISPMSPVSGTGAVATTAFRRGSQPMPAISQEIMIEDGHEEPNRSSPDGQV
ncbi:hypothetical protein CGRA01v4_00678 [Colletotrichum graminicola]|uniref:Integral membrane protein n=1 Tax=Colletotrichum graminicola (strain M1.001 / M2 / FGSC 10212) TaxID=645133 RepID=E3QMY1_COLGM|nr:uncharacterized protein GLRG_07363 [Colletotrichum graminicola M1.001]EFQ32219.1 hypothetical protein GLRG_07363 [Colletotrichum graminicola M1.001]WDK09400.1 hypothetical protein CGRA01v4_00678 [Colletotrichum graminicola]